VRGEIVDRLLQWAQNFGVAAREMDRYDFCSRPLFIRFFFSSLPCAALTYYAGWMQQQGGSGKSKRKIHSLPRAQKDLQQHSAGENH